MLLKRYKIIFYTVHSSFSLYCASFILLIMQYFMVTTDQLLQPGFRCFQYVSFPTRSVLRHPCPQKEDHVVRTQCTSETVVSWDQHDTHLSVKYIFYSSIHKRSNREIQTISCFLCVLIGTSYEYLFFSRYVIVVIKRENGWKTLDNRKCENQISINLHMKIQDAGKAWDL